MSLKKYIFLPLKKLSQAQIRLKFEELTYPIAIDSKKSTKEEENKGFLF